MTNNNITPPCPDCRHPSACHLHGCYTAASQLPVTMDGLVERLNQQHAAVLATLLATIERQREALEAIADVWSLPAVPMKAGGMKWHCQHEEWMASIADVARKALESQP